MFNTAAVGRATAKAEITERRILDAALELFRSRGFEEATMRDIAAAADVATGAAYYYYPSKESIVLAFYQKACNEMQPRIEEALAAPKNFEDRLRALIQSKLDYFAPYRGVLRALLKNGADPAHPLSPFAENNKAIRDVDVKWFGKILNDAGVRMPKDLAPHVPELLWMFQMGVIYFWVTDDSREQQRTARLLA